MRLPLIIVAIIGIALIAGCDNNDGPLEPELVDILAGSWSGMLDYTISGGVTTPMTLVFNEEGTGWLSVVMTTGSSVYTDDFVAEVGDNIVLNFDVAGESWELVLEGKLIDSSTFEGDIIQRETGEDDIVLGTFSASPS